MVRSGTWVLLTDMLVMMMSRQRGGWGAMSDRPAEHTTRVPVERDMDFQVSSDLESDKSKYQQDSSIR